MSHYNLWILVPSNMVPKDLNELKTVLEPMMAPFNEGDADSTNPKWDFWRIGGRWDGVIQGLDRSSEDGFNFGGKSEKAKFNTMKVADLLKMDRETLFDRFPFAFLTPEGEWVERGEMGWFGVVRNEKDLDDWRCKLFVRLQSYQDCLAVSCDCHI